MKRYDKILAVTLILVMIITSFSACATFDAFKAEFLADKTQVDDTVKIGVFEPLSGEHKHGGELEKMGIELAHELYPTCNGKKVELIYADNRSNIDAADEAIQELIEQKPVIVLGSYGSAYSLIAAKHLEKAKIPAISITNTNPLITKGSPYYFRVRFVDTYQGTVLAKYAAEVLGVTEVAIMRQKDDDSAIPISQSFEDKLVQMTGNQNAVRYIEEYQSDLSDITKRLAVLKDAGIKIVFLPADQEKAIKILKAAEKMKAGFIFLGTDAWATDTFISHAGSAAGMAVISTVYDAQAGINSMSDVFLQAYREKYGKDAVPEPAVALAFDAYMIALESLSKTGEDADRELIQQDLALTAKFAGASGNITFDVNGDAMKTVVIKGVKNQEFTNIYTMEPNVI